MLMSMLRCAFSQLAQLLLALVIFFLQLILGMALQELFAQTVKDAELGRMSAPMSAAELDLRNVLLFPRLSLLLFIDAQLLCFFVQPCALFLSLRLLQVFCGKGEGRWFAEDTSC